MRKKDEERYALFCVIESKGSACDGDGFLWSEVAVESNHDFRLGWQIFVCYGQLYPLPKPEQHVRNN